MQNNVSTPVTEKTIVLTERIISGTASPEMNEEVLKIVNITMRPFISILSARDAMRMDFSDVFSFICFLSHNDKYYCNTYSL